MQFEWDEDKRRDNILRRGVDLRDAAAVLDDPDRLEMVDERINYGERRVAALGTVDGESYIVIYTMRGEIHRLITAWKVGVDGRKRFEALYNRRDPSDAGEG